MSNNPTSFEKAGHQHMLDNNYIEKYQVFIEGPDGLLFFGGNYVDESVEEGFASNELLVEKMENSDHYEIKVIGFNFWGDRVN